MLRKLVFVVVVVVGVAGKLTTVSHGLQVAPLAAPTVRAILPVAGPCGASPCQGRGTAEACGLAPCAPNASLPAGDPRGACRTLPCGRTPVTDCGAQPCQIPN